MTIAILADATMKAEILAKGFEAAISVIWADSVSSLMMVDADARFDLKFENDRERTQKLTSPFPVFINAVSDTLSDIGNNKLIRLNGWPGMINRDLVEYACTDKAAIRAREVLAGMGWKFVRVGDSPGFVTAAIIAGIINEAFFALGENVATRSEIDLAMRTGTNYPFGPFEWAERIGIMKVLELLKSINKHKQLEIAPMLINVAARGNL